MPGYFEPIIGSNFDALAAQRQYWGGQNLATETGNVNRAAAAQQANLAEQSRAEDEARRAHQFDVNTQLAREDIARREADAAKQVQKMDEATTERARLSCSWV